MSIRCFVSSFTDFKTYYYGDEIKQVLKIED